MGNLEAKSDARILDATASNRSFWRTKESTKIIFIDIEPELEVKPDLVIDCTKTHFLNESIMMIVFDPPYWWGQRTGDGFFTCRNSKELSDFNAKYNMRDRSKSVTYYGTDRYKTKDQLLSFIYKAQKEFYRILYSDGLLWLNWCENRIELTEVLNLFRDWDEMLRLPIANKNQSLSESQNYWVMLMKKEQLNPQTDLEVYA